LNPVYLWSTILVYFERLMPTGMYGKTHWKTDRQATPH